MIPPFALRRMGHPASVAGEANRRSFDFRASPPQRTNNACVGDPGRRFAQDDKS